MLALGNEKSALSHTVIAYTKKELDLSAQITGLNAKIVTLEEANKQLQQQYAEVALRGG